MKMKIVVIISLIAIAFGGVNGQICNAADFENGIYHFPDSADCNAYRHCTAGGQTNPLQNFCRWNMFWGVSARACVAPGASQCTSDPCINGNIANYAHAQLCSAYWVCENQRTKEAQCCSAGQRFSGTSCVNDASCTEECPVPEVIWEKPPCDMEVYPLDNKKFYKRMSSDPNSRMLMDCAPGTGFNEETCGCDDRVAMDATPCSEDMHLSFDSNADDVNHRIWIMKGSGVDAGRRSISNYVGSGYGHFDGTSNGILTIPRFTWFGSEFRITFNFVEESGGSQGEQSIVTNWNCLQNTDPSISIKINTIQNQVIASIVTDGTGVKTLTASYNEGQNSWTEVELYYDGSMMRLQVGNGQPQTMAATGNVAMRISPLIIGGGCGQDFRGSIDELYLYDSCIPANNS